MDRIQEVSKLVLGDNIEGSIVPRDQAFGSCTRGYYRLVADTVRNHLVGTAGNNVGRDRKTLGCVILLGCRCAIKPGCVILLGLRCAINLGCVILVGFRCAIKLGCVILLGFRCAINLGCVIVDWVRLSCHCIAGI